MNTPKLGMLLNNLGGSQLAASAIIAGNRFVKDNPQSDLIFFQSNLTMPCYRPNFAVMDYAEVYGHDAVCIATDFDSAKYLIKCPGPSHRIFYVWDLEWLHGGKTYEDFAGIYKNELLDIVVQSEVHKEIFTRSWNRIPSTVVENADLSEFYKYVTEIKKPTLKRRTFVEGLFYAKSSKSA